MKRVFFEEIQPEISRIFYSQIAEDFFFSDRECLPLRKIFV